MNNYSQGQSSQDVKIRVEDMMDPANKHKPVVITDFGEYKVLKDTYKSLKNRSIVVNPSEDGLPKTAAERTAHVQQLCAAIKNFADIIDETNDTPAETFNKRASDNAVDVVKALMPLEVQLLAWDIFLAIWAAHFGRYDIPSWANGFTLQ